MKLADSMQAVEITQAGGPDVLRAVRRPLPSPGPGEVLIQVAAAGINRPDIMQRRGLYPPPPGASDLPGLEVAGTIVDVGVGVPRSRMGDPVCALTTGGGYAEFCTADDSLCLPVPNGYSWQEAAALPEGLFTIWVNLVELGKIKAGERLLIHGGSGGIGSLAIQVGRVLGAEVFATAGSPEKCTFCEQLGARCIDYRQQNFRESLLEMTEGRGVDLILDSVGAPYLATHLKLLATEGRLVIIGLQGGLKSEINLLPILLKRLTLTGSTLRPRSREEKAAWAELLRQQLWPRLRSGEIRPVIHEAFPLNQAAAAHRLMESSRHLGKIVLVAKEGSRVSCGG